VRYEKIATSFQNSLMGFASEIPGKQTINRVVPASMYCSSPEWPSPGDPTIQSLGIRDEDGLESGLRHWGLKDGGSKREVYDLVDHIEVSLVAPRYYAVPRSQRL
jgi:hypothetical protein